MKEVCKLVGRHAWCWRTGRRPTAVRVRLLLQEESLASRGFWVVVNGSHRRVGVVIGGWGYIGLHS